MEFFVLSLTIVFGLRAVFTLAWFFTNEKEFRPRFTESDMAWKLIWAVAITTWGVLLL